MAVEACKFFTGQSLFSADGRWRGIKAPGVRRKARIIDHHLTSSELWVKPACQPDDEQCIVTRGRQMMRQPLRKTAGPDFGNEQRDFTLTASSATQAQRLAAFNDRCAKQSGDRPELNLRRRHHAERSQFTPLKCRCAFVRSFTCRLIHRVIWLSFEI